MNVIAAMYTAFARVGMDEMAEITERMTEVTEIAGLKTQYAHNIPSECPQSGQSRSMGLSRNLL